MQNNASVHEKYTAYRKNTHTGRMRMQNRSIHTCIHTDKQALHRNIVTYTHAHTHVQKEKEGKTPRQAEERIAGVKEKV